MVHPPWSMLEEGDLSGNNMGLGWKTFVRGDIPISSIGILPGRLRNQKVNRDTKLV